MRAIEDGRLQARVIAARTLISRDSYLRFKAWLVVA